MILQQDGAPPHYFCDVRYYLETNLPNRWMERGGPIEWPSRSPDITTCDHFLWGYIKEKHTEKLLGRYSNPIRRFIEQFRPRIKRD